MSNQTEQRYYDFGDGKGAVPAHRHMNSKTFGNAPGGWVAETATVHPEAYIYHLATVRDEAVIEKHACIERRVRIGGKAVVKEGACVGGTMDLAGRTVVLGNYLIDGDFCASGDSVLGGEPNRMGRDERNE